MNVTANSLKIFLLLSFVVFTNAIIAQSKSTINFTFAYGSVVLNFDDSLNLRNDSSFLRLTALKFYISNIQFFKNGEVVLEEKKLSDTFKVKEEKNGLQKKETSKEKIVEAK